MINVLNIVRLTTILRMCLLLKMNLIDKNVKLIQCLFGWIKTLRHLRLFMIFIIKLTLLAYISLRRYDLKNLNTGDKKKNSISKRSHETQTQYIAFNSTSPQNFQIFLLHPT